MPLRTAPFARRRTVLKLLAGTIAGAGLRGLEGEQPTPLERAGLPPGSSGIRLTMRSDWSIILKSRA